KNAKIKDVEIKQLGDKSQVTIQIDVPDTDRKLVIRHRLGVAANKKGFKAYVERLKDFLLGLFKQKQSASSIRKALLDEQKKLRADLDLTDYDPKSETPDDIAVRFREGSVDYSAVHLEAEDVSPPRQAG